MDTEFKNLKIMVLKNFKIHKISNLKNFKFFEIKNQGVDTNIQKTIFKFINF